MIKNFLSKAIIVILIFLCMFSNNFIYASSDEDLGNPAENPEAWEPWGSTGGDTKLTEKVGQILGVINVIGVVSSVIVLSILGIKYMLGSIEEKVEFKKALMPYVIGVFLIAASTTIPNIIYNIING